MAGRRASLSAPAHRRRKSIPVWRCEQASLGPEEYGITSFDPNAQRGMSDLVREERLIALSSLSRESRMARDQRRRGIVIESLPCPVLLVTGTRGPRMASKALRRPASPGRPYDHGGSIPLGPCPQPVGHREGWPLGSRPGWRATPRSSGYRTCLPRYKRIERSAASQRSSRVRPRLSRNDMGRSAMGTTEVMPCS